MTTQAEPQRPAPPVGIGRVRVSLGAGRFSLETTLEVPAGDVAEQDVVPALGRLADGLIGKARRGFAVSCQPGCAACCRQLVPVSMPELRHITAVWAARDDADEIAARREGARRRLRNHGLADVVTRTASFDSRQLVSLARRYVDLGIACPFLVDARCTIYGQRPLSCREYAVTTPPAACVEPGRRRIRRVPLPFSLSAVVARNAREPGWRSLIDPPLLADDEPRSRAATWLRRLLGGV